MQNNVFDPYTSFIKLKILHFVVIVLLLIAALVAITIQHDLKLNGDWSSEGFKLFVIEFSLPLTILALLIPSVAMIGAIHKSEQTIESMRISKEQNNFANYYKHLEEFTKYMEKNVLTEEITADNRALHYTLYKHAKAGDTSLPKEIKDDFSNSLVDFIYYLNGIKSIDSNAEKIKFVDWLYGFSIQFDQIFDSIFYLPIREEKIIDLINKNDAAVDGKIKILFEQVVQEVELYYKTLAFESAFYQSRTIYGVRLLRRAVDKFPGNASPGHKPTLKAFIREMESGIGLADTIKRRDLTSKSV